MKNHNNKHNLIKRNIVVFFLLLSQIIFAQLRFEKNNIWYEITSINNNTVAVYGVDYNYKGSITIPTKVENQGTTYKVLLVRDFSFQERKGITSISIPNEVIFEDGTTSGSFSNCISLTSITLPRGVKNIIDGAFYNCKSLTSVIIPNSVTSIGEKAFEGCTSLTSITIPNSVTSIGFSAFSGCINLTSINLPSRLTTIESNTFNGCSSLTSIIIPYSVTSIKGEAFQDCNNITTMTCLANTPPDLYSLGFNTQNCILKVPKKFADLYLSKRPWNDFKNILPF